MPFPSTSSAIATKRDATPIIEQAILNADAGAINDLVFSDGLTEGQEKIVKTVLFGDLRRICITTSTRYGKTYTISKIALMWILFELGDVIIIAPQSSQAEKVMQYVADHILESPIMKSLVDTNSSDLNHLRKEVSKKRITFTTGYSIRIISAEGEAKRAMGEGSSLNLIDEACLINDAVYRSKISRMLQDKYATRVLISNPWHKQNFFFQAWESPRYTNIHIGWEQAVKEGRIEQEFIDEQRELLSKTEFDILYEAKFPDSTEDSLIRYDHILAAVNRKFTFEGVSKWGLDCAGEGEDETVLVNDTKFEEQFRMNSLEVLKVTNPTQTVAAIKLRVPKEDILNVDSIGEGAGTYSDLKSIGYNAVSVRVSRAPTPEKADNNQSMKQQREEGRQRYLNQKAQFYWRLRTLFQNGDMDILNDRPLIKQLSEIRWKIQNGKIMIIDPESGSPDRADALMLSTCDYDAGGGFTFAVAKR